MDTGAVIGLGIVGVVTLTAVGLALALVVMRGKLADAQADRTAAIDARIAALAELANAATEIKGLRAQLSDERLQKAKLYERLAQAGLAGAAELVDDHIRSVYPDADSATAGAGDPGPMPDRSAAAPADADADDLLGDRASRRGERDLL